MNNALNHIQSSAYPTTDILKEVQAQGYAATSMAIGNVSMYHLDSLSNDSLCVALIKLPRPLKKTDQERLENWLQLRTHSKNLRVYYDVKK